MGAANATLLCTSFKRGTVRLLHRLRDQRSLIPLALVKEEKVSASHVPTGVRPTPSMLSMMDWCLRDEDWSIAFSLEKHGASTYALGTQIEDLRSGTPCIAVIEDNGGYIFGCLWYSKSSRTGRTIVFGGGDPMSKDAPLVSVYASIQPSTVLLTDSAFSVGIGVADNVAIWLDDVLDHGFSYPSSAFDSPRLAHAEAFRCIKFDLWIPTHKK